MLADTQRDGQTDRQTDTPIAILLTLTQGEGVCVESPPSALNTTLPAFAAEAGAQQQTHRPPLLLSIGGTDIRTDGRTPERYVDPAPRWRRGVVVSGVRRMNEVNARRTRLVPGWVTVFGRVYHLVM